MRAEDRARKPKLLNVYWQDVVVGQMELLGAENWFVYGRWHPEATEHTEEFLRRLRNEEDLTVFLDGQNGKSEYDILTEPVDGWIEVRMPIKR